MSDGAAQSAWARVLVGGLVRSGARRAVICPGSRSTPLVLAVLAEPSLERIEVVDERVAGFLALGFARVEGVAPLVICTSGSALANLHPAVVEAAAADLPLLLLTADRPLELAGSGANQTIDQVGFYGSRSRLALDLDCADGSDLQLRAVRRQAVWAWSAAHRAPRGPVHLNLRFRKPLEPIDDEAASRSQRLAAAALGRAPRVAPALLRAPRQAVREVAERLAAARRPLVVGGPLPFASPRPGRGAARFARASQVPLVLDPGSVLHGAAGECRHPELLLGSRLPVEEPPDLVLQLGSPPTSSAWEGRLGSLDGLEMIVLAGTGWPDPQAVASLVVEGEIDALLAGIARELSGLARNAEPTWLAVWQAADQLAGEALDRVHRKAPLSEVAALQAVVRRLPPAGLLAIGNSLPIRHLGEAGCGPAGRLAVASQRGASGIDGLLAGAVGAARAWGRPAALVLGDLSALHDLAALAVARQLATPLVVVVLDNDGGRIFERLPVARSGAVDLGPWVVPGAGLDLVAAAGAFGVPGRRVAEVGQLDAALRWGLRLQGPSLVVVAVEPADAARRARQVAAELDRALGLGRGPGWRGRTLEINTSGASGGDE